MLYYRISGPEIEFDTLNLVHTVTFDWTDGLQPVCNMRDQELVI